MDRDHVTQDSGDILPKAMEAVSPRPTMAQASSVPALCLRVDLLCLVLGTRHHGLADVSWLSASS